MLIKLPYIVFATYLFTDLATSTELCGFSTPRNFINGEYISTYQRNFSDIILDEKINTSGNDYTFSQNLNLKPEINTTLLPIPVSIKFNLTIDKNVRFIVLGEEPLWIDGKLTVLGRAEFLVPIFGHGELIVKEHACALATKNIALRVMNIEGRLQYCVDSSKGGFL
ncbi:MAG: hypothetical protein IJ481_02805 [Alphaproteobacteria bacterium]|nr:hypothetical protein [Alphaproteobacteria bacterium]